MPVVEGAEIAVEELGRGKFGFLEGFDSAKPTFVLDPYHPIESLKPAKGDERDYLPMIGYSAPTRDINGIDRALLFSAHLTFFRELVGWAPQRSQFLLVDDELFDLKSADVTISLEHNLLFQKTLSIVDKSGRRFERKYWPRIDFLVDYSGPWGTRFWDYVTWQPPEY
jgi:hypothetical protein